ncbi:hypothetical protein EJ04DRAFT_271899 [Polyplosphaeria fusca]|uniref:Uncharacterized protein n=1 Tax=Polyplosphaeria fusca TaxID=682080 RepID=A0A9P4V2L6_9PLEO|nr:hypothetical protein EJ04DRAFT_271899 [Polyplosphaeria fusca]
MAMFETSEETCSMPRLPSSITLCSVLDEHVLLIDDHSDQHSQPPTSSRPSALDKNNVPHRTCTIITKTKKLHITLHMLKNPEKRALRTNLSPRRPNPQNPDSSPGWPMWSTDRAPRAPSRAR